MAAERDPLARTARTLAAEAFACEADAQAALDRWRATAVEGWPAVSGTVVTRRHQTRPGRPRKAAAGDTVTTTDGTAPRANDRASYAHFPIGSPSHTRHPTGRPVVADSIPIATEDGECRPGRLANHSP
jgi:hypothetical protein